MLIIICALSWTITKNHVLQSSSDFLGLMTKLEVCKVGHVVTFCNFYINLILLIKTSDYLTFNQLEWVFKF